MLTCLDLFSGGGGLHLAAEQAGDIKTIAFSEVGEYQSKVLATRWPGIPNLGDITSIVEFPAADIICGGFPCQDLSVGNPNGAGLAGRRSGLWFHQMRAIEQIRPSGILIENSDQLITRGLNVVLEGLAATGYDAEWYTVRASGVGAPHKRTRVCIIAYRQREGGERLGAPFCLGRGGSWEWSGAADLRKIFDGPYVPGARWPQPLLRRVDDGLADRAHRLTTIGNGVVVPLFTQFFTLLKWRLYEYNWYTWKNG